MQELAEHKRTSFVGIGSAFMLNFIKNQNSLNFMLTKIPLFLATSSELRADRQAFELFTDLTVSNKL